MGRARAMPMALPSRWSSFPPACFEVRRGASRFGVAPPGEASVNMEDLWRFGIPVSIRRVLWPFRIGNSLGVSKELYQINRAQGLVLRNKVLA